MALASALTQLTQDGLNRMSSYISSKIEEKASRAHLVFRLEMAVNRLGFALERTCGTVPITHVSLLHLRKAIQRVYNEGTCLLNKHKMQLQIDGDSQQQELHEEGRRQQAAVMQSSSSFRFLERIFARCCSSSSSSLIGWSKDGHYLTSSNVAIYERYVEDAEKFVRDVESAGACLHRQPQAFAYPLVTWLLQGETLTYRGMQGRSQSRRLHISPVSTDGRGVEAQLCYCYADRKMPSKHFEVVMLLRIVESTDIVGTVISCLRVLTASLFKDVPVPDCASGEISLLSDLQDISHSRAPPFHSGYFCIQHRELFRPYPVCCTKSIVSSRVSSLGLPEAVFSMHFSCFVSPQEYIQLRGSTTDGVVMNAPLYLTICLFPHSTSSAQSDPRESMLFRSNSRGKEYSECKHVPDGSIQLMETTLRSMAAANHDYLIRRPSQVDYSVDWRSPHGKATMYLTAPSTEKMAYLPGRPTKKVPSSPLKASKRKR